MVRRFPLYLIFAADNFGLSILYPLLSMLIFRSDWGFIGEDVTLAAKNLRVGFALSLYPLAQYFGVSFFGYFADRYGRKKTLFITVIGTILGFLFSALAILAKSLFLFYISRFFTGFFAGNALLCMTTLADLSETKEGRARSFGYLACLGGVCWFLATFVGGRLVEGPLGPSFPFFFTAFLGVCALAALITFKETIATGNTTSLGFFSGLFYGIQGFRKGSLQLLTLAFFLWFTTWVVCIEWFAPIALQKFEASQAGITNAFLTFSLAWAAGHFLSSRWLLRQFSLLQVTWWAAFLFSLALGVIPFISTFFGVVALFSWATLFASITWSQLLNLISLEAKEGDQGMVMGIGLGVQSLAWIVGPLIGAALASYSVGVFYGAVTLLSLFSVVVLKKSVRYGQVK